MERKKTILIIDNDRAFTSLVDKFLKDICGYEVKIVPDGYNGVIIAKKLMPELVLLDIRMPAMNGLDILEKLKTDLKTARIPVMILTGFDNNDIKNKALSLKAADYLVKPIDLEILRERLAVALDG
jgi:sigma-B regulation protein RsbU (phosphoserine phosphatase)